MAVTPLGPPSQAQFFGVVALGGIILVVTAAFMTQKPIWMTGQEPSLGVLRPFTEAPPPPPVFTAAQLKKIAEGQLGPDGQPVPPAAPAAAPGAKKAALTSLAAAEGKPGGPNPPLEKDWPLARQVAQKPGAMVHLDDQYTTVLVASISRFSLSLSPPLVLLSRGLRSDVEVEAFSLPASLRDLFNRFVSRCDPPPFANRFKSRCDSCSASMTHCFMSSLGSGGERGRPPISRHARRRRLGRHPVWRLSHRLRRAGTAAYEEPGHYRAHPGGADGRVPHPQPAGRAGHLRPRGARPAGRAAHVQ
mmetsp:Transcript_3515/g.10220  ORF Transcript_3515/g.10220 Transcript_3515/m.10220 type:complete len:304 (-) Transcript_3515:443-1354(-)